ncbi:hypothetical protein [Nocardia cyriacigeorgica]|uniref:oxidoreductase n=1 Tax=Nocardia cyriacigeorgica TaxID=135487 RepID=UPI001894D057|nr:hypothetical protein [Nocardia cyriacigeorgica]MBF6457076.1 hypothetical protein [Nocardia cyriacigeorgica]MBF6476731.1 hypothetical protein [Nocardia cyriacigeorgica]MBF6554263.1 hypothetical protein [Nocardia cyriacigeorgica]
MADCAREATSAGFDGVERHDANGYLLHQFLSSNADLRTDGRAARRHRRDRPPRGVPGADRCDRTAGPGLPARRGDGPTR